MPARSRAFRETRLRDSGLLRQTLEFAVSRMLLASARGRMIRHQQLDQRTAYARHGLGVGLDRHALLGLTNARSCENSLTDIHYADPAHAHRILILLVA